MPEGLKGLKEELDAANKTEKEGEKRLMSSYLIHRNLEDNELLAFRPIASMSSPFSAQG